MVPFSWPSVVFCLALLESLITSLFKRQVYQDHSGGSLTKRRNISLKTKGIWIQHSSIHPPLTQTSLNWQDLTRCSDVISLGNPKKKSPIPVGKTQKAFEVVCMSGMLWGWMRWVAWIIIPGLPCYTKTNPEQTSKEQSREVCFIKEKKKAWHYLWLPIKAVVNYSVLDL